MSGLRAAAASLALAGLLATACTPDAAPQAQRTAAATQGAVPAAGRTPSEQPPVKGPRPPLRRASALGTRRPPWLGRRVLPLSDSGYGEVRPTPPVLRRRRFPTIDLLPPPAGGEFAATVTRVPPAVVARSTWSKGCPIGLDDLRYVTVSFWGFDRRAHTGELLVNAAVADDIVAVFRQLHRQRFPVEQMRVVDAAELDLPPTGDGNNTTAFVCRPVRGAGNWSQHAYGLAIDVNPFFNPYVKGEVVLPELASHFTDRDRRHPGMHDPDGPAVRAFAESGWEWGGRWSNPRDWMHFSATGG